MPKECKSTHRLRLQFSSPQNEQHLLCVDVSVTLAFVGFAVVVSLAFVQDTDDAFFEQRKLPFLLGLFALE